MSGWGGGGEGRGGVKFSIYLNRHVLVMRLRVVRYLLWLWIGDICSGSRLAASVLFVINAG